MSVGELASGAQLTVPVYRIKGMDKFIFKLIYTE